MFPVQTRNWQGGAPYIVVRAKVKHASVQAQEAERKLAHAAASTSQPVPPPRSRLPADVAARWRREDAEQLADVREQITGEALGNGLQLPC